MIGDEIHSFDDDESTYRHFVVNKVSGNMIQKPARIYPNLHSLSDAMFVGSRNSIVVGWVSRMGGSIIMEYSLTTKQWEVWEWARAFLKDYHGCYDGFVSALNGRYILSFGGLRGDTATDSIMIFDAERKQCVESELKLPMKGDYWQAVLMTDQNRDELLAFGFVKRCYKAEEFKNMRVLPIALISLISKCFEIEFVHLIMGNSKQGPHCRINVDDILRIVSL